MKNCIKNVNFIHSDDMQIADTQGVKMVFATSVYASGTKILKQMFIKTYYSKDHQGTFAYHVFAAQLVGFKNMAIFTVKQEKALDVVFTKTLGDKSVNLDFASEANLEVLVCHLTRAQNNCENHL